MKAVKYFMKPFEAGQRSVKIKIEINFLSPFSIGTERAKVLQKSCQIKNF